MLLLAGLTAMSQVDVVSESYSFSIGARSNRVVESDVDVNIPQTRNVAQNTFVVIIANEKYNKEQDVPFAMHDGETFKAYCEQTLGIPADNIRFEKNATLNTMRHEFDWLQGILTVNKGDVMGIVYYSGHGIPNPEKSANTSYLLPIDGYCDDPRSGYSLDELYAKIGGTHASRVTYFIDACFSGADRDGLVMDTGRGTRIKSVAGALKGNSVVFSAAQGDQTAYAYRSKSHGMFTYFLLKKLQESKGKVSYGELAGYLQEQVEQRSMHENSKLQSPSTQAASSLENWKNLKF